MILYKFNAYGHPNITATHKTTLELTKDKEVSLKGNCIVGVKADFDLSKIKQFIKKVKKNKVTITIKNKKTKEKINALINLNFNSNKEFVVRKTDFTSERTLAIKADKAAFDLNRDLINFLKFKNKKISVIVENKS